MKKRTWRKSKNDFVLTQTRVPKELLDLIDATQARLAIGDEKPSRSLIIREALRRGLEIL